MLKKLVYFLDKPKLKYYFLLFLFALVILSWHFFLYGQDKNFHLYFFDVGEGDSIFIKTPSNQKILIDGGPDDSVLGKLGKVLPPYDKKIDLVILTHPHADHLNGLIEVLRRYKVSKVISTGVIYNSPEYLEFLKRVKEEKINFSPVQIGYSFNFGGVHLSVLYPFEVLSSKKVEDPNKVSLVLKLEYQNTSALLLGDIPEEVEEKLVHNFYNLDIDILKVPHHGAENTLDEGFLRKTTPALAIISVGKNKFGHPSPKTLEKLQGIEVRRTDNQGTIEIISQGGGYETKNER